MPSQAYRPRRPAACGHDFLIAFSCKGRDICPSCATRRMVETAAHLTDQVLPRVPYRQWVLSVPKRVRWHLSEKPEVIAGLLRVFLRAVETTLRQRSPGVPPGARFGAVAFVHRFGSYLNSHVHSRATSTCWRPTACSRATTPAGRTSTRRPI